MKHAGCRVVPLGCNTAAADQVQRHQLDSRSKSERLRWLFKQRLVQIGTSM
jgi:hypothetical protein